MSESFAQLFEQHADELNVRPGQVISATVVEVGGNGVIVNAGLKSECLIVKQEFTETGGILDLVPGDEVQVVLEALEDGTGSTRLSREKARRREAWITLETAYQNGEAVNGMISGKVKGGYNVELSSLRAFLPGSLVDVRSNRETPDLDGMEAEFKIIKMDQRRNNVVVSRRAVLEDANNTERKALMETLREGMVMHGTVKNLTDYGAFVSLGGLDGLLHITDMSWRRIKHPREIVTEGDELDVAVLSFDKERSRVSLGLKQLGDDPWVGISMRHPTGSKLTGKVTNLMEYGCFVELEDGVEGLVHVSEMDWVNRSVNPSKKVQVGEEIEVMVLDIHEDRRRISLGMKQCQSNPWQAFAEEHKKGDRIEGEVRSITDFGLFVSLSDGVDGLVHLRDIIWDDANASTLQKYKKGDVVAAIVLSIDVERERIALGIKHLDDPFTAFISTNGEGSVVTGEVVSIDKRTATVDLGDKIHGVLKASEVSVEMVDDINDFLSIGEKVSVQITKVNTKTRNINLSIKRKDIAQDKAAVRQHAAEMQERAQPLVTVGALIQEQLKGAQQASEGEQAVQPQQEGDQAEEVQTGQSPSPDAAQAAEDALATPAEASPSPAEQDAPAAEANDAIAESSSSDAATAASDGAADHGVDAPSPEASASEDGADAGEAVDAVAGADASEPSAASEEVSAVAGADADEAVDAVAGADASEPSAAPEEASTVAGADAGEAVDAVAGADASEPSAASEEASPASSSVAASAPEPEEDATASAAKAAGQQSDAPA